MAGAPTKGFPVSLLSDLIHALRSGDETSKPFPLSTFNTFKHSPGEQSRSAAPELTQLQQIAGLRRGTATRQAAFRAARRRERSRRSKVAASTVPLLLLGSAAVPAIAFATTGGSSSKPAVPHPTGGEFAFDSRTRLLGAASSQQPSALAAPPTTAAPPAPPTTAAPPTTTGTAAVVSGTGRYLGMFVVTCYDLGGHTATGATPTTATVAVDPRVIPLGTRINIAGVGERIAQDTGGAIRGNRLDIWEPTYSQCAAWGVRDRQVWVG